jgi:mannose-6-phosphate isomerase-like protein (cupin superfamily)/quinol monooxygenase YgiN
MNQVARYGTSTAHPGRGEELACHLLAAAAELESDPGCELYLVNRQRDAPDTIWITELWRSQADLDAAVQKIKDSAEVAAVLKLVERWEMVELELLGGKGAGVAAPSGNGTAPPPFTIEKLTDTEDMAPKFGLGEMGEARFVSEDLAAQQIGVSHQRLLPGKRQPFAHRHDRAEEVYVVLSGSGRVKLDDEIEQIGELDAIRVAPAVTRAFEAGPDGLEFIVFGARRRGDGEVLQDWWSD